MNKISRCWVEWMYGWISPPKLGVELELAPKFKYDARPLGHGVMYYAQSNGWVSFYFHDPQNETGYGGTVVTLNMTDGSVRHVRGPWASRASVAEKAGFPPSVSTVYGHVTLKVAIEACRMLDVYLVKDGIGSWVPSTSPNTVAKPNLGEK